MRKNIIFNKGWLFQKTENVDEIIDIPHTWNAIDGQDGGNDYYRGVCKYLKSFKKDEIFGQCGISSEQEKDYEVWLELEGAAMMADVEVNGIHLIHHDGGFSTFRVNMTGVMQEENQILIQVDNSYTDKVYPQKADFTFYGGIYRDIKIIVVPKSHFALSYYGSQGIKVTPEVHTEYGEITVEVWTEDVSEGELVSFEVLNAEGISITSGTANIHNNYAKTVIQVDNPHMWDGIKDPYLYTMKAALQEDSVETKIGFRTFFVDADKGFYLNGHSYPLCGAARHQDRQGKGNAISREDHKEDMEIMLEMGVNTIRLAHYQHDQYFYDLCDENGMIVWAEIPYITQHMPEARDNSISQMKELIAQNYHHPSIVCWGLSNEITAGGGVSENMIDNHQILNDLCHNMDITRLTTMAHAFMLDANDSFVTLPDIRSYNLYYGWYLGELENNDEFFDEYHQEHPDVAMGLSEYGADANPAFQSPRPEKGDWTESYQAVYHEHMLAMWKKRPFIWAMHCWNMFDFGADGRNEGGKPGQNQKGLVTFDRKIRKDAFYIYKAYLSTDPFVYICGRRYVDRVEEITEIKVYSNQKTVTLYVDGRKQEEKSGDKVFQFQVPISGKHKIEVKSQNLTDCIQICKVEQPNPDYYNGDGKQVENWFDKPEEVMREGYYSILDSMADIKQTPEGADIIAKTIATARESYGEVAKSVKMPESTQRIMDRAPFQSVLKQAGKVITPAMVKEINYKLNQIPKE